VTAGPYDSLFSAPRLRQTRAAAEVVVPLVLDLVRPRSVVDLGCGVGTWLASFARRGIDDHLGVDGEWVRTEQLEIDPDRFLVARLDRPFSLDRTFDLAVSLEVAEHLPERAAEPFVESLTRLAPCVLFSAAVPGQGGVEHVNEQWPTFWAERFEHHGFLALDAIRPRSWSNPAVAFWYRQNTLLFARSDAIAATPRLAGERALTRDEMLAVVHPELFEHAIGSPEAHSRRVGARELSLRELAAALLPAVVRSVRYRLRRG
jgi:SAM-dependent methyltransferase